MKKTILILLFLLPLQLLAVWEKCNGPYGANVTCLAKRGNLMFAGTDNSKIFKSTDAGRNWEVSIKVPPGCTMNDIQIFGNNVVASADVELFQSQDLGKTWDWARGEIDGLRYISSNNVVRCGRKLITVINSNTLYMTDTTENKWFKNDSVTNGNIDFIASNDTILYAASYRGLIKSDDYGYNWQIVKLGNDIINYGRISITNNFIYAGKMDGSLSVSTDNGVNWYESNTDLKKFELQKIFSDENRVFICKDTGIIVSYDRGLTWKSLSVNLDSMIISSVIPDGDNIYVGTKRYGVLVSTDNGLTWSTSNNGFDDFNVRALTVFNNELYIGNDLPGCYRSSDEGKNLENISPQNMNSPVSSLTQSNSKTIYLCTFNAIFSSPDNGKNWLLKTGNLFYTYFWVVNSFFEKIYIGTTQGVFYCNDSSDWSSNVLHEQICSLGELNGRLFAGTYNSSVYISNDSASTWKRKPKGIGYAQIHSLLGKNNRIYAGTSRALYYSVDYGENWIDYQNFPSTNVLSLLANDRYLFTGTENGVFISYDDGVSWKQINTGLGDTTVYSLAVDSNYLFAGTSSGLWRIKLDGISSVENIIINDGYYLYCYPNPATDFLEISLSKPSEGWQPSEGYNVAVFNVFGTKIPPRLTSSATPQEGNLRLDVSSLPPGVYFVKIGEKVGKFIKL